jgi:hypothetical protein
VIPTSVASLRAGRRPAGRKQDSPSQRHRDRAGRWITSHRGGASTSTSTRPSRILMPSQSQAIQSNPGSEERASTHGRQAGRGRAHRVRLPRRPASLGARTGAAGRGQIGKSGSSVPGTDLAYPRRVPRRFGSCRAGRQAGALAFCPGLRAGNGRERLAADWHHAERGLVHHHACSAMRCDARAGRASDPADR